MNLKNLEIKRFHLFSLAFFGAFIIGLFFTWFDALGVKSLPGTLIISSAFPAGLIAIIAFLALNFITIVYKNNIYIHICNLYPIVVLALLSFQLVAKYDEFSLSYGFYISVISLALSFIFSITNILFFKNERNESIPLD